MENFKNDSANKSLFKLIDERLRPAKAIFGTHNAIRKARGEPPFTDDINAFAEWCEAGEPEDPAMEPVLKRLVRDGYTS
jgi:hypothetical protein